MYPLTGSAFLYIFMNCFYGHYSIFICACGLCIDTEEFEACL